MRDQEGTDGWVATQEVPGVGSAAQPRLQAAPDAPLVHVPQTPDEADDEISRGRPMAILAYASILFGLPIFLLPLLTRDNAFALHHAKAAGAAFIGFVVAAMLTTVSCGLFFPLMFLFYAPALIGAIQAANGQLAGQWGLGDVGERLFRGVQIKEDL